jgi:hypothetical protein
MAMRRLEVVEVLEPRGRFSGPPLDFELISSGEN